VGNKKLKEVKKGGEKVKQDHKMKSKKLTGKNHR
jgi:hypothetical protein